MTKIEYVKNIYGKQGESWNPITGCTKVSPGCKNCYAEKTAKNRLRGRCGYPMIDPFQVLLHPDRLDKPLKRKKSQTYFVCNMSDLFHEKISDNFKIKIFTKIAQCPQHIFIILTKRPENALRFFYPDIPFFNPDLCFFTHVDNMLPENIIFGVTVENQEMEEKRLPLLRKIPAKYKFVSIEPMLEFVNIFPYLDFLDWVIVGGEKAGDEARYFNPDWARDIRDQCKIRKIPFFMKQMNNKQPIPEDLNIKEYPEIFKFIK